MQRITLQENIIQTYLDSSNQFYQNFLGYKPEQTSLQQIPESQWNEFATQRGVNPNSFGIYLPRNQTAVIPQDNTLSLFHEYFGHGLYCEQNLTGRKLVDLEKRLLEEEKQEFSSLRFSLEDLQKFRQENQTFQELENFRQENLGKYELFAIWTEYLLSGEHDLRDDFERKYDSLSRQKKEAVDSVINFSEQYGDLATMYTQGMARRTTPERVKRLLEDIYKDKLEDVRFALLYGSRKEFSDIDVFMVGDEIPRIRNDWIDVSVYSPEEFLKQLRFFDVAVTDAIVSGEFLLGDRDYFEEQKARLKKQPITEQAIKHNFKEAIEQESRSLEYSDDSEERRIGLSYSTTSRLMAENLKRGEMKLTKNTLITDNSDSIELKGGKRK